MVSADAQRAVLTAHPSIPSDVVRSLAVHVRAGEPGMLVFQYSLDADMSRVRVPSSGAAGLRTEGLWKHTCFEAFVAAAGVPGYHEFNFSPSLDWAVYRFTGYRAGMLPADPGQAPDISLRRAEDRLELEAAVRLADLAVPRDARHLRIALTAVVEEENGTLSYWALKHPRGKPDFHHPDGFTLELAI
jgi:hypothetical protein